MGATKKNKKCYNCKHGGKQFKIAGKTHLHCEHPKYKKEDFESGKLSPWDTLREFWETCENYELKEKQIINKLSKCPICNNNYVGKNSDKTKYICGNFHHWDIS